MGGLGTRSKCLGVIKAVQASWEGARAAVWVCMRRWGGGQGGGCKPLGVQGGVQTRGGCPAACAHPCAPQGPQPLSMTPRCPLGRGGALGGG